MTSTVAVVGATGTLGSFIAAVIEESSDFELVARLDSRSPLSEMEAADLVIDATTPAVSQRVVQHAVACGKPIVVGTSGWSQEKIAPLRTFAAGHPGAAIAIIPNFSLGSTLVSMFAAQAARFFSSAEIVETHHPAKIDSPSGTAIRTAELMADARGACGPFVSPHVDQRARGQSVGSVPIHSLRVTGVAARQDVIFGAPGETVTLTHDTYSSEAYRAGILLSLRHVSEVSGVTVGLDSFVDLSNAGGAQ